MNLLVERVLRAAKEIITTESDRDRQRTIGPSDMADPCLLCLGKKLAGEKPYREFSMFPWLGTAMHKLIEWTAEPIRFRHDPGKNDMAWEMFGDGRAIFEARVFICTIPGYGDIYGTIDVLSGETIIDWKSTSKKRLKVLRLDGPPPSYRGQLTMYLHAARELGYNVSTGVLVFIPRDTFTPDDIWAYPVDYDPALAQAIIDRVAATYEWVKVGRHHELPSDSECNTCHPKFYG